MNVFQISPDASFLIHTQSNFVTPLIHLIITLPRKSVGGYLHSTCLASQEAKNFNLFMIVDTVSKCLSTKPHKVVPKYLFSNNSPSRPVVSPHSFLLVYSIFNLVNQHNGIFYMHAAAKSLQSCPTLRDPIDGSPPEWVAISFSDA